MGCLSCEYTAEPLGAPSVKGGVERARNATERSCVHHAARKLPTCPQKAYAAGRLTPRAPSPASGEPEPGTAAVLVTLVSLFCRSGQAQSCSADEERYLGSNHCCCLHTRAEARVAKVAQLPFLCRIPGSDSTRQSGPERKKREQCAGLSAYCHGVHPVTSSPFPPSLPPLSHSCLWPCFSQTLF